MTRDLGEGRVDEVSRRQMMIFMSLIVVYY